ncbi:MAG: dihydrolipoamide acetyltransferase family protein, partial [Elusimicrobia bacterium]|nr:dihydrolipoamide acetyltransferase family protein [Elusimicrobiota bacterium]
MAFEFKFPDVGEGLTEGEIVAWKVKAGDVVEAHQPMLEVETDKAVVEIPAPRSGRVLKLVGEPGKIVKVGEVIAVIGSEEEFGALPPPAASVPAASPAPRIEAPPPEPYTVAAESVGVVGRLEEAPAEAAPAAVAVAEPPPVSRPGVEALPKDRELAKRLGVDIELLHGTGPKGRVTEADVRRAAQLGAPQKGARAAPGQRAADAYGPVERLPLRGVRRRIASAMAESLAKTAQVTSMVEAEVDELWRARRSLKTEAAARGVRLTLLPFLVKAVVGALKRVPELNASLDEE